jgi:thiol-disulfide isomerase/thioredoxin
MSVRQIVFVIVLGVASAVGGFFLYRASSPVIPDTTVSEMSPAFVLQDVDGKNRHSSEWDGRARLVNFWATWCPPCRREIPLLIDLQNEYGERVKILGIAIDDLDAVQEFAANTSFNYPILIGQQNAIDLANTYLNDFIGLPFTAFVDSSGHIVRVHVGELHRDQAETFISEIL